MCKDGANIAVSVIHKIWMPYEFRTLKEVALIIAISDISSHSEIPMLG